MSLLYLCSAPIRLRNEIQTLYCCVVDEAAVRSRLEGIPPHVWGRLFPFQRVGVRRGVQLGGRCLLADEMGLGKTVQVRTWTERRRAPQALHSRLRSSAERDEKDP